MHFFSEAAGLTMETAWLRRPKRWESCPPPSWYAWQSPTLSLQPTEPYTRRAFLRLALMSAAASILVFSGAVALIVLAATLLVPHLWPFLLDPRNHQFLVRGYHHEKLYRFLSVPLLAVVISMAAEWPRRFFWNRRAKRLQQEKLGSVPTAAAAVPPDDPGVWPPSPRRSHAA